MIYGQHKAHQQRQQQHAQSQHNAFVLQEAQKFEAHVANDPPAVREQVFSGVIDVLKDAGINPQVFEQMARRGDQLGALLASSAVHKILYEASKGRLTGKSHQSELQSLRDKVVRDAPLVSAPGARGNGFSQPALSGAALTNKIASLANRGGDKGLKAAAAALAASRRGGR
jgi:hypothetical protein